jgi:hypothetical protein
VERRPGAASAHRRTLVLRKPGREGAESLAKADCEGNTRRDLTKASITSEKDYDVLVLTFTLLLMRRPLSHSTMAGPTTYFRDARMIEVTATESCTVWFVGKEKKPPIGGLFWQYESVIWLVFD